MGWLDGGGWWWVEGSGGEAVRVECHEMITSAVPVGIGKKSFGNR